MTKSTSSPKLHSTIKALVANGKTVDLPKIFRETGVCDRIEGEKLFKKTIEEIIRQPYDSPGKRWAKTIKGEGYRFLHSAALADYWKELAIQRASDLRLQRFYIDEAETLGRPCKRQKAIDKDKNEHDSDLSTADIECQEELEEVATDNEGVAEEIEADRITIARTWAEFIEKNDFSESHIYRLERHGIIQCGIGIKRSDDVPDHLYNQINLISQKPTFPFSQLSKYIMSVLRSKEYGTPNCDTIIFSKQMIDQTVENDTFSFISRLLFQFSEYIHSIAHPSQITDSEVAYCHEAIWPLLRFASHSTHDLQCEFKLGETQLKALKGKDGTKYNADGVVFTQTSKLEILLLEASGAMGTIDRRRHVFDHVKGAYGCHAMIVHILEKYPYADKSLIEKVQVIFVHTSARDDKIRVWVMKPQCMGRIISFERVKSCTIPTGRTDITELKGVIEFFWLVKELLAESVNGIEALRKSNDDNILTTDLDRSASLKSFLNPTPMKPDKKLQCDGIVDLDPVSFTT
ncbi:hypothetical protein BX666DRAFT_2006883 [Dichotomocladium elegans]|nr:hypothetical protein BX666DRAFT_2006883 [Dichotomocladium elegans]